MKKIAKQFLISLCLALVLVPVIALAATSKDALIGLGISPEVAEKIYKTLIGVDSTGNIVLPVASSKKLSVTVAGTEKASVSSAGLATFADQVSSTGLQVPVASYESVAGAGTTVSDAAALASSIHVHRLTGANGTVGWKFASATAGQVEILLNTTAGVPKVYAVSGGTCNGGAADAACTLTTGIFAHVCYATASNAWICG